MSLLAILVVNIEMGRVIQHVPCISDGRRPSKVRHLRGFYRATYVDRTDTCLCPLLICAFFQIAIDSAIFPEGTSGSQLDVLARRALWKDGLNYLVSDHILHVPGICA